MRKIISLAILNLIQGTREKVFWLVVFFFVFLLSVTFFMSVLSPGQTTSVLRSAGLSGIELSGIVLIVFSLIFSFYRERDFRLTELLLSYFSRPAYIGGKLFGYLLICLFYLILAGLGLAVILFINKAFDFQVLAGIFTALLKLSIITSVALVFCCLFTSPLIAMFSTLFIFVASEVSREALKIISLSQNQFLKLLFKLLYHLLPNMDKLDIKSQVIYGKIPPLSFFISITFYSLLYTIFLWCLATYIFLRKEA